MSQSSQPAPAIGFYTVDYHDSLGWTGGYLVLNAGGRPLEFHCTLPVRPTRAHEILYGATLRAFLIGELIGGALLKQSKVRPMMVCGDQAEALRLADHTDLAVALVADEVDPGELHIPTIRAEGSEHAIRIEARFATRVRQTLEQCGGVADMHEPFLRIREAIREAQQGASAVPRAA